MLPLPSCGAGISAFTDPLGRGPTLLCFAGPLSLLLGVRVVVRVFLLEFVVAAFGMAGVVVVLAVADAVACRTRRPTTSCGCAVVVDVFVFVVVTRCLVLLGGRLALLAVRDLGVVATWRLVLLGGRLGLLLRSEVTRWKDDVSRCDVRRGGARFLSREDSPSCCRRSPPRRIAHRCGSYTSWSRPLNSNDIRRCSAGRPLCTGRLTASTYFCTSKRP